MSTNDNRTIPSNSQTTLRVELLRHCFLGRTDAFAQVNREGDNWICIRRELPSYLLQTHLQGRIALGTYPQKQSLRSFAKMMLVRQPFAWCMRRKTWPGQKLQAMKVDTYAD